MEYSRVDTGFEIAPTTYCQARCYACQRCESNWSGKVRADLKLTHMEHTLFENIVNQIANTYPIDNISHIRLCGESGDPMMHPEIEQFITTVLSRYTRVGIQTNGGLRKPEWYAKIGELYKNRVTIIFGIDGTDHDTNWKYREGVDWNRAMDNMISFNTAGGTCVWQFIIFPWNIHQIDKAMKIARETNIDLRFIVNGKDGPGVIDDETREQVMQKIADLGYIVL